MSQFLGVGHGQSLSDQGLSLTDASKLFKIKYEKLSENVYNSANVLLGRVKKSYNFTGKQLQLTIPQSFAGGVGSGKLPSANVAKYSEAIIKAKKVYAVVEIDRETIKAALSDEGAFVRATKEVVKKGVESYMRNMSRILFNDGSGKLGSTLAVDAADAQAAKLTSTSEGIQVPIADMKEANFEERDLIDVTVSASASVGAGTKIDGVEIIAVDPDEKTITLDSAKVSLGNFEDGSGNLQSADLFMQNSENNDPIGLKVLSNEAGETKLHEVDRGRRWNAQVKDAEEAAISTDMLNEMMLKVKKACGKTPNLIVTSFKQYEKILNLLEDQKRYTVNTRAGLKSKSGADISFSGVQFMSVDGPIGIFPERFVEDDRIYLLNDSHIHIYHRPDFGWFDDDGTVFLRKAGEDSYEARYGGYLECYINPCFHGVIHGLSV